MAGPFALDRERVARVLDAMERCHRSRSADKEAAGDLEALGYEDPDPGPYDTHGDAVATLAALVEDVLRPGHQHSPLAAVPGHWLQVDIVCDAERDPDGWRLIVGLPGGVIIADVFEEHFPDLGGDDPVAWLAELVNCANGIVGQAARFFVASPNLLAATYDLPRSADGDSDSA